MECTEGVSRESGSVDHGVFRSQLYVDINVTGLQRDGSLHSRHDGGYRDNRSVAGKPGVWSLVRPSSLRLARRPWSPISWLGQRLGLWVLTVTAHIGTINPQSSGRIKFRIVWNHVMPAGTMLTITAEATASDSTLTMFPQSTTYTTLMT